LFKTYCDRKIIKFLILAILNIDFSTIDQVTLSPIKKSETKEYTIEFWTWVYVYSPGANVFTSFDIYWDLHNRVTVFNNVGALQVHCYSLSDKSNPSRFSEKSTSSLNYAQWSNVRCGTNLLTKKFFLNLVESTLQTVDIPDLTATPTVSLQIGQAVGSLTNWGVLFIRNLKLWQEYNFNLIDTSYM